MAKLEAEMAELGAAVAGVDAQHSGGGVGMDASPKNAPAAETGRRPHDPGKGGKGRRKKKKKKR